MATEIWVNIGSGNGLLPDGTKPLPEPMLTDHQLGPVRFILGQFHKWCLNQQLGANDLNHDRHPLCDLQDDYFE